MEISERYERQVVFAPIGPEGQRKLAKAFVVVAGCGALGSTAADLIARAGVGRLRVVDRDFVELSNLPRQALFDTQDVLDVLPKAEAARRKLAKINPDARVEAVVSDVSPANVLRLLKGADVVVDGSDNVETRYLVNDAAIELGIPWIYGGAVGCRGMVMTIVPGKTACLRCLFLEPPPPGTIPTCETDGIIGPTPHTVGSLEAAQALKLITCGAPDEATLTYVDVWERAFRNIAVNRNPDCPACVKRELVFLRAPAEEKAVTLCARNGVQVSPGEGRRLDLSRLEEKLKALGPVFRNQFLLRAEIEGYQLNVFPDGRAIIKGTSDPQVARSVYSRYIARLS